MRYTDQAYRKYRDVATGEWVIRWSRDNRSDFHSFRCRACGDGAEPGDNESLMVLLDDRERPLAVYNPGAEPALPIPLVGNLFDLFNHPVSGGSMTAPIVLEGEIVAIGGTPDTNLIAVTLPGATAPTTRRFTADHLSKAKGGAKLKAGDKVHVRLRSEPAERVVIEEIATLGNLEPTPEAPPPAPRPALEPIAGPDPADLPHGIAYVDPDPLYIMPADLVDYVESMELLHRDGVRVAGVVTGPYGNGKTDFVRQWAAKYRRPYVKVDFGTLTTPDELLGHREFGDGRTATVRSLLLKAFQTPHTLVHADEINRTSTGNTNALLPLLDHTGSVWSDFLQEHVVVDPTVIFIGTANLDNADTGTFTMNGALKRRLKYPVVLDFPQLDAETQIVERRCRISATVARALVEFAREIRQLADSSQADPLDESIGTATLIDIGHLIRVGLPAGKAIGHCVLPRYSKEGGEGSQQYRVAMILQGRFGGH